MDIVFIGIFICPLFLFFLLIRKYRNLVMVSDQEERLIYGEKAKKYFILSLSITLIVLLYIPVGMLVSEFVKVDINLGKLFLAGGPLVGITSLVCVLITAVKGVKYAKLSGLSSSRILLQKFIPVVAYFGFFADVALILVGMGWGRPLRVAGKVLKPSLQAGNDWAQGERPDVTSLDIKTSKALEALWLHDAKKEYASVPAFSRLGWQLTALAASPELLRDVHIAALQEIEHARKCFALAAGFGSEAQTVLPMPEMLKESGGLKGNPFIQMAIESLSDGCLLEGFNADIAHHSAQICLDPASLKLIKQIAREERSHAELSWRIVEFCYQQDAKAVGIALRKEMAKLANHSRPTASSSQNLPLIQAADQDALIRYGRLPDKEFDVIWNERIKDTNDRLLSLLEDTLEDQTPSGWEGRKSFEPQQVASN